MTRKELFGLAAIVVAVSALVFVLFMATSWLSLSFGVSPDFGRNRVLAAYETGVLADASHAFGNTIIGAHQHNDCLILGMAIEQREPSRLKLAISPQFPDVARAGTPCAALRDFVKEAIPRGSPGYYHNYMHGHTVLARILLRKFSVEQIRLILSGTLSIVIMGVMALAMFRLARGRDLWAHLPFLIIGLCLARWFGLEAFGQSLGHAPADLVAAIFVLFLCAVARWGVTRMQLVIASALFGCLTMVTEFLTGGLPLGLALVVGASPFVMKHGTSPKNLVISTAAAGTAFVTAAGLSAAFKLALAFLVFGSEALVEFTHDLSVRMALANADEGPSGGIVMLGRQILMGLSALAGGAPSMLILAGIGVMLSAIGGLWGLLRVRSLSDDGSLRIKALMLAASNLVIVAWVLVFSQHTIVHAWFMDRIFVWTIASGSTLFAMGVIVSRGRSWIQSTSGA